MKIIRVLSVAIVSLVATGIAAAQDAPKAKRAPLRNSGPMVQKSRPILAPEFGGVNIQYQRISAMQFTSDVSTDPYTSTWNPPDVTQYQRWFSDEFSFNHLVSSPTLPGGARIVYLELDACDDNTLDQHVQLTAWNCDFLGSCDAAPLSTLTSTSDAGFPCSSYADNLISYRVDNFLGQFLLDVTFGATDGSNTFAGVIVGYVLEVSPAPAEATFLDVPTSSPQFQFVEALVEAGITAGCGGGNYCPNNPVTRGQMAVFLSKLAGLSWNGF